MAQEMDYRKCRFFDDEKCPGISNSNDSRSLKTIVGFIDGKEQVFADINDFIKAHKCHLCPKYSQQSQRHR